jgi:hypothetical protein
MLWHTYVHVEGVFMILLNVRRFRQFGRLHAMSVLACFCALSFAVGCNGGKATGASQPTPGPATPAASASTSQSAPAPAAPTPQSASQQTSKAVPQAAPPKPVEKPKKPFSEMTAMEVAQNPAAYGFVKNGDLINGVMVGRDIYIGNQTMIAGENRQWVKHKPDGNDIYLSVHFEQGKPTYARWGGF